MLREGKEQHHTLGAPTLSRLSSLAPHTYAQLLQSPTKTAGDSEKSHGHVKQTSETPGSILELFLGLYSHSQPHPSLGRGLVTPGKSRVVRFSSWLGGSSKRASPYPIFQDSPGDHLQAWMANRMSCPRRSRRTADLVLAVPKQRRCRRRRDPRRCNPTLHLASGHACPVQAEGQK